MMNLTPPLADRMLRRVRLFEELRTKVLTDPNLHQKLLQARTVDVPQWWQLGTFDKELLADVVKYGIGNKDQWDEFLAEDSCPFYQSPVSPSSQTPADEAAATSAQYATDNPTLISIKRQWFQVRKFVSWHSFFVLLTLIGGFAEFRSGQASIYLSVGPFSGHSH